MRLRTRRWIVATVLLLGLLSARAPWPASALEPGAEAVVSADGDCLRMRMLPGLASTVLTCIPDGSTVAIPGGEAALDGIQWQRVEFAGQAGWSDARYLRPAVGASTPTPPPLDATLTGSLPPGGVGLAVWGGGPVDRMGPAAAQRGCDLRAVWTTPSGAFIGYVFGAPAIVNAQWLAAYPGNTLAANTPVIVVCAAAPGGQPTPAPTPIATPIATPPTGPGQVAALPPGTPSTPPGPAGNR